MYDVVDIVPQTVVSPVVVHSPASRWRLASRVAFRFCATYFTLSIVSTQMLGSLFSPPALSRRPPLNTDYSFNR